MTPTSNPIARLSMIFNEAVERGKFVNFKGKKCGAGERAAGVSDLSWGNGDEGSVVTNQTALVKVKATLNVGASLTSDASGDAVLALEGDVVNAILLKDCSANELAEVFITSYIVPPTAEHTIILPASAKIEDNRFVQIASGEVKHAGVNGLAIGVVVAGVEQAANATVTTCGIVNVLVGDGGVTENTYVTSDADGKAIAVAAVSVSVPSDSTPVTSTDAQPTLVVAGGALPVKVLGVALASKSGGELVAVKLY